jgi:hypothetical protein
VITGFNTDIEHDGVVYHVQTEDKGLDSPLILSLVYSGGAILASKRSRYEDLIAAGFDEEVLSQRLKRQHRLICAAINAGRLEELKRMGGARPDGEATPGTAMVGDVDADEKEGKPRSKKAARSKESKSASESAYTVYDPRRQAPLSEVALDKGPLLSVLDENEFHAGGSFTIRVLVEGRAGNKQKPLSGVAVSVKILGTTFRPQIYSVKTQRDGVAVVDTTMPHFTSGRAAVLIRAVIKDETIELRRVIHPAA